MDWFLQLAIAVFFIAAAFAVTCWGFFVRDRNRAERKPIEWDDEPTVAERRELELARQHDVPMEDFTNPEPPDEELEAIRGNYADSPMNGRGFQSWRDR